MVETITPVVHGGHRKPYLVSVLLHTLGTTVAAGAFGALLGGLGALLDAPWGTAGAIAVLIIGMIYVLREALGLPIPIPDRRRQVPQWWRTFYSPPVASLLYGLGLGIGFLTFLTYGTFVAVAAGALVSGDAATGAFLCAPFGLARGLSVLVGARSKAGPIDQLAATAWPRRINAVALLAVVVAAAASL